MRTLNNWEEYKLLDTSCGARLEQWGDITLIRPDPQGIWKSEKSPLWRKVNLTYTRTSKGGGYWNGEKKEGVISYKDFKFKIKPTDFKHLGLFPEQAVNWEYAYNLISNRKEVNVLNLFAYTGAMSVVCAKAGANVTHVDSSKGIVTWAKENATLNGISNIRFIVDDCAKFVEREIRRGKKYDIIIMDPPSYGRGSNGEVWKFEDNIYGFLKLCKQIFSEKPLFLMLNSYTTGISSNTVAFCIDKVFRCGKISTDEIGLKIKTGGVLPCGHTSILEF
ncbi:MAG: class I SAM-dependent methyltransferase [Oscillospiraceae bacterium]|jgi:23S rRNA (cytosine1962-C5)-methyltransferase|nr:class I SAM-dependent methyltransferase [Oscillospiraceae bacterium]